MSLTSTLVSTRKRGISARSDGGGRFCVLAFSCAASCAIAVRNVVSTCFIELRNSRRSNGVRDGLLARYRQASLSQFLNACTSRSSSSAMEPRLPRYSAHSLCDSRNPSSLLRHLSASRWQKAAAEGPQRRLSAISVKAFVASIFWRVASRWLVTLPVRSAPALYLCPDKRASTIAAAPLVCE
jgi:hypothetical protein